MNAAPSEQERAKQALALLCLERPFAAITAAEVAARAELTPQRFRELFGDVEGCAVEVENANLADVVAAVSASYAPDRSEWESALHGVLAILELMGRKPAFAYFGYVVARQMGPRRVREIYSSGHQTITAMLERGWEYSDLETQPLAAARGALGGAEAVVRREVVAGRAARLPDLLPDFVYAATVPFLGQEEALRLADQGRALLRRD
jgi:AraC-like DNA-binding protein